MFRYRRNDETARERADRALGRDASTGELVSPGAAVILAHPRDGRALLDAAREAWRTGKSPEVELSTETRKRLGRLIRQAA